ncbi:hypothetical protein J7K43_01445 [Candidatus Calescamantes bacterium]|nr:hypothetical protein [Candidatus Calescamantes bacterium]
MVFIKREGRVILSNYGERCYEWGGESIDGYVDYDHLYSIYRYTKRKMKGQCIVGNLSSERRKLLIARIIGEINLDRRKCRRRRCHAFLLDYPDEGEFLLDYPDKDISQFPLYAEYLSDRNVENYIHFVKVHPPCENTDFCNERLIKEDLQIKLKKPEEYRDYRSFEKESLKLIDQLRTLFGTPWKLAEKTFEIKIEKPIRLIYCCEFLYPKSLR